MYSMSVDLDFHLKLEILFLFAGGVWDFTSGSGSDQKSSLSLIAQTKYRYEKIEKFRINPNF